MLTSWQAPIEDDLLLWLLEEENPSAHYLTLRHLLDCADQDSQTAEARAAIPGWAPVHEILSMMDPVDFWGRADKPFYGGAVGTHAMLNLLADLGMERTPQIEAACENLFEHGQHPQNGGFTYDGTPGRTSLCYTGNAIRTLVRFGYGDDPRLASAVAYLVTRSTAPGGLGCVYAEDEVCQWGITKALAGLAELPAANRTAEHARAIQALADAVLDHTFDLTGRDARWLDWGFPLDYQSDLSELCEALARLDYGPDPRFQELLDIVVQARQAGGGWTKRYGTRALQVEGRGEPSKWITIRVLRAIKHAQRAILQSEKVRLNGRRPGTWG